MRKKRFLGHGFGMEVFKATSKVHHLKKERGEDWKDRLLPNFSPEDVTQERSPWFFVVFTSICLICFFIILSKLFSLQIIWGKVNKDLADGNRIQIKVIHAQRGVIHDRNGEVLAANSPAFRLSEEEWKTKLITREQALELEVKSDPLFSKLEIDNVRTYAQGEKLAHVLGYVGEISKEQLTDANFKGYRIGDRVGKGGVEKEYEKYLKGVNGGEVVEVDSTGKKIRTLRRSAPVPGRDIYLTIDLYLQKVLYDQLSATVKKVGSCCGAAIALNTKTGEILALASLPSFDPNIFTARYNESEIEQLLSNPNSPVLNRAIAGTYPPGSTFKIISSLAALSSGKITSQTQFVDNGVLYLGTFKFTNWYFTQYGKTEGSVNLVKALKRSNDTYFYEAGRIIGEEQLVNWSKKLKLGESLGIDLPGEEKGLVPTDEWKQKTFGEVWYPGDTLHMAIGQGFVLTTPLQILGITSFIAANGELYKPHLLSRVMAGEDKVLEHKKEVLIKNLVKTADLKVIQEGLVEVPKVGGTAWPFFTFPIKTAGKTGTSEFGDPKGRTHAWYSGYAPVDDPKIAVVVLVEGGGEGSSVAAPIVKEIFRWYFSEDKNKLIQDIYPQATDSGKTLGE